ncbi:MAG: hypothetical protein ABII82_06530 [Verrucomicrobiota bacterium]
MAFDSDISRSSSRTLCAVLIWCAVIGFVVWHAAAMDGYLRRVTAERFPGEQVVLPREQIPQGTAFDGQTWIRVAEHLAVSDGWRLRQSVDDNAPEGRPVYWSSAWGWWLIGAGKLWSAATGLPFAVALERAAVWANLPVLAVALALLGWWCARRWGVVAGAVYAMVLVGHRGFYAAFYPGNPDHHGIIAACGAGVVLTLVLGGLGWHRGGMGAGRGDWLTADEDEVGRLFTASAVFGAVGMWFSAASTIPVMGALAVAVVSCGRPGAGGAVFCGDAWRRWGRLGGGLCLGFYFLEQFPDRLGWRLEVNHPVYALAWAGGAELLAWFLERRAEGRGMFARGGLWRPGLGLLGLAAPVVVLLVGGGAVFGLTDPFMARVHANVTELESMARRVGVLGWRHHAGYVVFQPLLLAGAIVFACRLRGHVEGYLLRVSVVLALLVTGLGWWQNRWMLIAGGPLALAAVVWARCAWTVGEGGRRGAMVIVVPAFLVVLAAWQPWQLWRERQQVAARRDVQADEARQLLYREVARAITADAGGVRVLLAAAPDASTGVTYFGDFGSLGTLYWENRPGLFRAGRLLGADDEEQAAELARRWGVTHVALFGFDGGGGLYRAEDDVDGRALGPALLEGTLNPAWLRPVYYALPSQFGRIESRVRLFAVDFEQTPAEAAYRHGMMAIAYAEFDRALICFRSAAALSPDSPAPWMRLGELQLLLERPADALRSVLRGVAALPAEARERAYLDAAKLFGAKGARAEADVLLDRAMETGAR